MVFNESRVPSADRWLDVAMRQGYKIQLFQNTQELLDDLASPRFSE